MHRWFYICGFVCLEQLFYLSVEAYLGSSTKEARALAPQICSHFLDPDAVSTDPLRRFHFQTVTCRLLTLQYLLLLQPLKIKVREEYLSDIGATADGFSSFLTHLLVGNAVRCLTTRLFSLQRVDFMLRKTSEDPCRSCSSRFCQTSRTRFKTTGTVKK